jgi:hypothetical protein
MLGAGLAVVGLTMVAEPRDAWAVGAGSTLELQVTGVAGVPSDAVAVVLNMTAVNAQAPGFVTVYPCGQSRPEASNLNYAAGQTIPNLVIAKPGVGGKVCIYSYAAIDVLADVSGFFPAGSGFVPISNPTRVLDTRNGIGAPAAPVGAGSTLELQVTGVAGVPSDAVAVVLNMTAVNAQAPGFVTVYPCGQSRPEASNLNYAAGQTIPNLVIAKPGVGGKVCIYSYAAIDVLADVSGFFPAGSGFVPISNPTRVLDTRTPPPTPTPTVTLVPGTTLIGSGAPAGRYIAQATSGCYWERLSGLGGTLDEIIANDFQSFAGPAIVDIRATDLAFEFDADCGTFRTYTPPASASATITQGAWVVGSDIQPGT